MADASGVIVGILLALVLFLILFLFAPQVWVPVVTREVKQNPDLYQTLQKETCPPCATCATCATCTVPPPCPVCETCEPCPPKETCPECPSTSTTATCPTCQTCPTCPTCQICPPAPSSIPTGTSLVGPVDILRNGSWILTMQSDGNVVLYNGSVVSQSTGTNNPSMFVTHMTFASDGQLSFLTKDNVAVVKIVPKPISTGESGTFDLSNTGDLSIMDDSTKQILWQGTLPKGAVP